MEFEIDPGFLKICFLFLFYTLPLGRITYKEATLFEPGIHSLIEKEPLKYYF